MTAVQFPQIFHEQDGLAIRSQKRSRYTVIVVGLLAIVYEVIGILSGRFPDGAFEWSLPLLTVLATAILLAELYSSSRLRLEVPWYDARAAAESIKTVFFRYLVAVEPFSVTLSRIEAEAALCERIEAVMRGLGKTANGKALLLESAVLDWGWSIRAAPLTERIEFYVSNRIKNQIQWYSTKSIALAKTARRWSMLSVGAAAISLLLASTSVFITGLKGYGSLFLQIAIVTYGYVAIRNYRRDARAYEITAAEIEDAYKGVVSLHDDAVWSHFVDEIEEAFSREHVTWRASHTGSL